jgi:hypothetical protein
MKTSSAAQPQHCIPTVKCCLSCSHPNVSIYNINKLFLSSSQHCGGVYICVGHLSNSSQWALAWGEAHAWEQLQLEKGTESVLGKKSTSTQI